MEFPSLWWLEFWGQPVPSASFWPSRPGAHPWWSLLWSFAGAPVVNALVSTAWHRPKSAPEVWFYVGLVLAAAGAFLVLRFRPT
ncbi:MAG: hypothetical protein K0U98_10830 [Deltaproteobacteria bacterium]|nr:hypothetical protein [Deltaproteobacteria bacterium]